MTLSSTELLLLISVIGVFWLISVVIIIFLIIKTKNLILEHKNAKLHNYILQVEKLKTEVNHLRMEDSQTYLEHIEPYHLTKREIEVLKHITKGYSNQEIAKNMYLSKNTIKTHIKNIYAKLDVHSRLQVINKVAVT